MAGKVCLRPAEHRGTPLVTWCLPGSCCGHTHTGTVCVPHKPNQHMVPHVTQVAARGALMAQAPAPADGRHTGTILRCHRSCGRPGQPWSRAARAGLGHRGGQGPRSTGLWHPPQSRPCRAARPPSSTSLLLASPSC